MLNPDFHRVSHLSAVQAAARDYREAWRVAAASGSCHADAWSGVKEAESRVNALVEREIYRGAGG
jgi:hypothetical protein